MRSLLLASLSLFTAARVSAQPLRYSLEEAQVYAIDHNTDALNAQLNITSAHSTVDQALRNGLPQVNAEVSYLDYLELPTSLIPAEFFGGTPGEFAAVQFGTKHNLRATVSASQLLFDGSFLVGVKASRMFVELQTREAERKEIDIKVAVAKAYFSVLVASRNLALLQESHGLLAGIHSETNELFKAGFVEAIEVDRLTLALTNLEAQISGVARYQALSESLLKFQMGLDLATPIELSDSLNTLIATDPGLGIMAVDVSHRVEWDVLEMQMSLAEMNIKRYQAGYLPSLSAFANFDYSAQRSSFDFLDAGKPWFPMAAVGVSLRVPIWDSFLKAAAVQKERTNLQMIMNYREQLKQGLNLEAQQARTAYENASEQEKALKSNLALAQKIMRIAAIKYSEGVGSSLEVSASQSTLIQTQSAYINALYELLIAKTDLEKALGTL